MLFIRRDTPFAFKLSEPLPPPHQNLQPFLRIVRRIRLSITATLDYEGSKGNHIYADIKTELVLEPAEFYTPYPPPFRVLQSKLESIVERRLTERIQAQFGDALSELAVVMGLEYAEVDKNTNREFTTTAIWSHASHARSRGLLGMGAVSSREMIWVENR